MGEVNFQTGYINIDSYIERERNRRMEKGMGTSRDKKMAEVPVVSYGDLSLTGALISIARFFVRNLKKIIGGSTRARGRQEERTGRFQKNDRGHLIE